MKKHRFPNPKDVDEGVYIQYVENASRTENPHAHPFLQIFFLLSGKLTHHINNISAEMTMGEMAIIPPNVTHFISLSDNPSYFSLSFNLSTLGEINDFNEQTITFLKSIENSTMPIFPKTTVADRDVLHMQSIFEHIHDEILNKEIGYRENVTAYITLLINQFIRRYFIKAPSFYGEGAYTSKQMVLTCIKYIDTHITEDLSLTEMAKNSAVSVSTFCRYFKQITGKSFADYLKHKRIAYANELIKKGYEITVISSLCGFGDFSCFFRSYKSVMGISPSEYRKTLQSFSGSSDPFPMPY